MKKLLFILLFIPLTLFSQNEKVYEITTKSGKVIKSKNYRINKDKGVVDIQKVDGEFIRFKTFDIVSYVEVGDTIPQKKIVKENDSNVFDVFNQIKDSLIETSTIEKIEIQEKKIIAVINVKEKSKKKLYSLLNKWVSLNYNSANNVIQMNDKDGGILIVKGINSINYKNPTRILYPRTKMLPQFYELSVYHTLEINVKDNRFRIIYTLRGINRTVKSDLATNPYSFECISLKGSSESSILNYNNYWEPILKSGLMSKKNRKKYKGLSKQTFDSVNASLAISFTANIVSMLNSINLSDIEDF